MAGGTELKILFGEAWLLGVTRQRLAGEVPCAREGNTLCCFGETLLSACQIAPFQMQQTSGSYQPTPYRLIACSDLIMPYRSLTCPV